MKTRETACRDLLPLRICLCGFVMTAMVGLISMSRVNKVYGGNASMIHLVATWTTWGVDMGHAYPISLFQFPIRICSRRNEV